MAADKVRAGEAEVTVSIRDRVQAGLKGIEGRLRKFSASIGSVGVGVAGVGAAATATFGGLAGALAFPVKLAADLEQTTVAFETMLGSADEAQKMLGQLRDFAASTPLAFDEIADASKKLLAFGVSAGEVEQELRRVGDIALGIGAPIGEIAEIYGKAKVQGRLFAEDINQLTGRGIPVIQMLAKQFGVMDDQVKKLVESGQVNFGHLQQAFKDLTAEGGTFGGMMAKQAQTLNGQWSTLKDNVLNALIPIGQSLAEVLKPIVSTITSLVTPLARLIERNRWFAKVLGVVAIAGTVAGVGITVLGGALIAVGAIAAALIPIVSLLNTVLLPIWGTAAAIGAAIAAGVVLFAAYGAALLYVAHQAGLIAPAFAWLKNVFGQLAETVQNTMRGIVNALSSGRYRLAARILWAGIRVAFLQGAKATLDVMQFFWNNLYALQQTMQLRILVSLYESVKKLPKLLFQALGGQMSLTQLVASALFGMGDENFTFSGALDGPIAKAQADLANFNRMAARANAPRGVRNPQAGPRGAQLGVGGLESRQDQTNRHLSRIARNLQAQPRFQ